jgi:hypothetical protein
VLDIRLVLRKRVTCAPSVAAFLGVQEPQCAALFAQERLSVPLLHQAIESGIAGPVRRAIDVRKC